MLTKMGRAAIARRRARDANEKAKKLMCGVAGATDDAGVAANKKRDEGAIKALDERANFLGKVDDKYLR